MPLPTLPPPTLQTATTEAGSRDQNRNEFHHSNYFLIVRLGKGVHQLLLQAISSEVVINNVTTGTPVLAEHCAC